MHYPGRMCENHTCVICDISKNHTCDLPVREYSYMLDEGQYWTTFLILSIRNPVLAQYHAYEFVMR